MKIPAWLIISISMTALIITLPACTQQIKVTDNTTPRRYPYDKSTIKVIDIQVKRDKTNILITNTTANSYNDFDLWLNERYLRHVNSLKAGETKTLSLYEFVDEYSEGLKVGGFLATGHPDPIIKAEIETNSGMIGLIAVADH